LAGGRRQRARHSDRPRRQDGREADRGRLAGCSEPQRRDRAGAEVATAAAGGTSLAGRGVPLARNRPNLIETARISFGERGTNDTTHQTYISGRVRGRCGSWGRVRRSCEGEL